MKNLLRFLTMLVFGCCLFHQATAQSPQNINYQAVARNSETGEELVSQEIFISLKILKNGPDGEIVYQENHDGIKTNAMGLFHLFIGGGNAVSGSFNEINWQNGAYWLAIDIDAGNGLESMGAMQFVSVPYALHAETVTHIDDADADPTNELVHSIHLDMETKEFSLVQENGTLHLDMSSLVDDADNDPTNELVQAIEYNNDTKVLTLVQEVESITVDLSEFIKDQDSDPTNELVQDLAFDPESNQLTLVQEGGNFILDLGSLVDDADADPTNELVQDVIFENSTKKFTLVQEGEDITRDLSEFIKDQDSDPTNELVQAIEVDVDSKDFTIVQEGSNINVNLLEFIRDGDSDPTNELINVLELVNDTILKIQEGTSPPKELNLAGLKHDENWQKHSGEVISNIGDKVAIGTNEAFSTLQINGSIGHNVTVLKNNAGSVDYNVSDTDYIIVCRTWSAYSSIIHIRMPDSNTCPGRLIIVRKTGGTPVFSEIRIHFDDGPNLDFSSTHVSLVSFSRETATFLSLGPDGWTRLD